MEAWTDQGIIVSLRPHGEGGAVVSILTEHHGRHAGYVHGAQSAKKRAILEPGTEVSIDWQARTEDQLGTYKLEQMKSWSSYILDEAGKLSALLSACHLCEQALPEREMHQELYYGTQSMLEMLQQDIWGEAYVMWEIALLRDLGFAIDLSKCAAGGNDDDLMYISPKSGRAVSRISGEPYKDKLLRLPDFLKKNKGGSNLLGTPEDLLTGLKLTGYFLEYWVFAQHSKGMPEARLRFQAQFAKKIETISQKDCA